MDIGILNLLSRVAVVADSDQQDGRDNELLKADMFRDVMNGKLRGDSDAATNAKRLGEFVDHIPTLFLLPEEKASLEANPEAGLTELQELPEGLNPEVAQWLMNQVETLTGAEPPVTLVADVETVEVISADVAADIEGAVNSEEANAVANPHAADMAKQAHDLTPASNEYTVEKKWPDVSILPVEIAQPEATPSSELRDMLKPLQHDDDHLVLEDVREDVVIAEGVTDALVDVAPEEVVQLPVIETATEQTDETLLIAASSEKLDGNATVAATPATVPVVDVDGASEPVIQGQALQRIATEQPAANDSGKVALPDDGAADDADGDVDLDEVVQRILDRRAHAAEKPHHEFARLVVNHAQDKTAAGAIQELVPDMVQSSGSQDVDGVTQHSVHSASLQQQASERLNHANLVRASQFAEFMDDSTPAEQVKVSIKQAFKAGIDRLTIQLDPADLGRVEVRIEVSSEGRNHIVISADNRDTLDLLQRDARMLERALQESGLEANAGDMEFNLNQREASDGEGDGSMPNGAYGEVIDEAHEPELYLDPYTGYYTITLNEGLDIKV